MNCDVITEQMSDALDGQLGATRQAAFDAHLARCRACREGYASLEQAVARIRDLEPVQPPADLTVGINAAIDRSSDLPLPWNLFNSPSMRVALAASVVLVIGFLGIQYLGPAPGDTSLTVAATTAPESALPPPAVTLDEAVPEEDDVMLIAKAEPGTPLEVDAGRREPVDLPAAAPTSAFRSKRDDTRAREPMVARDGVDRDEGVWTAPAPDGVVGGLSSGEEEVRTVLIATEPQVSRARAEVAVDRRLQAQAELAQRGTSENASTVLLISVEGLSHKAVLQAAEELVAGKDDAPVKEASRQAVADHLVVSRPAPERELLDEELAAALENRAEYIMLQLSRPHLETLLERLGAQNGRVTVGEMTASRTEDERIRIRLQIIP